MHEGDKPGFGEHLAQAREAAGFSREEAARKLRLSSDVVGALEREDYEALPAPAYVRGYIRAYAQLLEADAEELVARYNVHAGADPELSEFTPVEPYRSTPGPALRWGSVAALVILAALTGFWVFENLKSQPLPDLLSPESAVSEPEPPVVDNSDEVDAYLSEQASEQAAGRPDDGGDAVNEPPAGDPVPGQAQPWADLPAPEISPAPETGPSPEAAPSGRPAQPASGTETDRQSVSDPETAESDPVVIPETAPEEREVVPVAPQGDDRLRVDLNGTSWVEVYDANGYQLIYGLFGAGDRRISVRGQAPFQVVLGDARQVGIVINDTTFGVEPFIRWNNTARLTVDPPAR